MAVRSVGAMMRRGILCLAVSLLVIDGPASACTMRRALAPQDVVVAEQVVMARVIGFQMVRDEEAHRRAIETLANLVPGRPRPASVRLLTDYARLKLAVEETLKGEPTSEIDAIWVSPPYSERFPDVPGLYLVALGKPTSPIGPARGEGAIAPASQPAVLQVLQTPCAPAFVLQEGEKDARAVRAILAADRK